MSLSSFSNIPVWIIGFLLIFLVFLSWYTYRQKGKKSRNPYSVILLFRSITFFCIALLLLDLKFSWSSSISKTPIFKVFFDNSVSLVYHQSVSRESLNEGFRNVVDRLQKKASEYPGEVKFELYSFGAKTTSLTDSKLRFNFDEPTTDFASIFENIYDVSPDKFLAGIIVLSDGQVTMGDDPLQVIETINVPIYAIGIGQISPMIDVNITKVEVPTVGVKGETISAEIFISSIGSINEKVNVTLAKRDKLIGSKIVEISGYGSIKTVKFQFQLDKTGPQEYSVRVSSLKDEINIENNRTSFEIMGLKNRFRLALITGVPTPNTSFLKRVLQREKRFQVEHFVNTSRGWIPSIAKFWRSKYDLVILDNFPTSTTNSRWIYDLETKLMSFPSALLFVAGPNVDLEKVKGFYSLMGFQEFVGEPDFAQRYPIVFTEDYLYHPVFSISDATLNPLTSTISLPPIKPYLLIEPRDRSINTLAYLEWDVPMPLFCIGETSILQHRLPIRIALFTAADLWQLHFRIMATNYASFIEKWWLRTFNWLVKLSGENDMYFRLNKRVFQQGEAVHVVGTILDFNQNEFKDGDVIIKTMLDDESVASYPLTFSSDFNRWEGNFLASRPGSYKYVVEAHKSGVLRGKYTGSFKVEESQIELNHVYLNKSLLEEIAKKTGGSYYNWEDRTKIWDQIQMESQDIVIAHAIHLSQWFPLGLILIIVLAAEWIFRRLLGLL